ncbi:MAG: endonuclease [Bacteroidetes bacterium]|nr:MAG: endonuclease [Bacteroidota bacterium]REJ99902.1 MAG: endonuclease [Bacteroidota bacterium]REK34275.1 MAG: endonuclease [Bacteroidota bacterium]REK50605.1 MAG: endonuclease [Bacteroidota bacterium]
MLFLAFSLLSAYVSPERIWWLALFGLGFGPLFLINLLFLLFWILRKRRRVYNVLILILLCIPRISGILQFNFDDEFDESGKVSYFKLMSFNVRLFDLYNWFNSHDTKARLFSYLKKEAPDVICFQEYYTSTREDGSFRNTDSISKHIARYSHIEFTTVLKKTDYFGIATFSRFPIINRKKIPFPNSGGNFFIYTDIVKGKDTVRVFNTHLESVRLKWEDYRFIENLGNDEVNQDELDGGMKILKRLRTAYQKRVMQVSQLRDTIRNSPYPVILCGDFNDTPSSYSYRILSDKLLDAFRESGSGLGNTYAGPLPSFRIDFIFHSQQLKSHRFKTYRDEKLSDHYPITCLIELPGSAD